MDPFGVVPITFGFGFIPVVLDIVLRLVFLYLLILSIRVLKMYLRNHS